MLAYMGSFAVSTGKDFGSSRSSCLSFVLTLRGVDVPLAAGVAGGVKAGEMSAPGRAGVEEPSSSHWGTLRAEGRGCGARIGEACEGRSGILCVHWGVKECRQGSSTGVRNGAEMILGLGHDELRRRPACLHKPRFGKIQRQLRISKPFLDLFYRSTAIPGPKFIPFQIPAPYQ